MLLTNVLLGFSRYCKFILILQNILNAYSQLQGTMSLVSCRFLSSIWKSLPSSSRVGLASRRFTVARCFRRLMMQAPSIQSAQFEAPCSNFNPIHQDPRSHTSNCWQVFRCALKRELPCSSRRGRFQRGVGAQMSHGLALPLEEGCERLYPCFQSSASIRLPTSL